MDAIVGDSSGLSGDELISRILSQVNQFVGTPGGEFVFDRIHDGLSHDGLMDELRERLKVRYDSTMDTINHIREVQRILSDICARLAMRGVEHDASKLTDREKPYIDEHYPRLRRMRNGTHEHQSAMKAIQPALMHHYMQNSHHPEHFDDGVSGMSLLDICEMFAEWMASARSNPDGDILRSIEVNKSRYNMDAQLVRIFQNTVKELENGT